MRRSFCFGILAALVFVCACWARQGVVYLSDGTTVSGDIDESNPDHITVVNKGIEETFPRDHVDSVEYFSSVVEQFDARMAKLSASDVSGRLDIARWAQDIGQYDLARQAVAEALAIDPSNPDALDLMRVVNSQASLAARRGPPHEPVTLPVVTTVVVPRYLDRDQINRLRQRELKTGEGFAVRFDHDVRKRYLDLQTIAPQTFYSLSPIAQARMILEKGQPSMANDVRITSEPASLVDFRSRIGPMLRGGCAVSGCHDAATAASGFALFDKSDELQVWQTNFYILESYHRKGMLMIDRTYPEKSILAQYTLPPQMVIHPHPPVKDLHPMFVNRGDPRYRALVTWMGQLLRPDAVTYSDLRYDPPWVATTQPFGK